MYKIDENKINKCNLWKDETIHVLTDFDRTLTIGTSASSWSILSKSGLMPEEYAIERDKFYKEYRPYEIDESLDFDYKNEKMIEWWKKHIGLFIKYKLSEDVVNKAIESKETLVFRKGATDFLKNMYERKIPVIIISAGIGNFIEGMLKNNDCYYDNIYIISNFIEFDNGIATGIGENIIHSLNKNEASMPKLIKDIIRDRDNIILLGDQVPDILMASEDKRSNALKIGFINEGVEDNLKYFNDAFDVVLSDEEDFNTISDSIDLIGR